MSLRDALVEGMFQPDDDPTDNEIIAEVLSFVRERNQFYDLLQRSWTIVHKRARVVLPGDLVANESGKTWHVDTVKTDAFETEIKLSRGFALAVRVVARDTAVPVLMPIPTRDGLVLLRGGLGAQLVPIEDEDAHEPPEPPIEGAWRDGQVHLCPLVPQPHVALRDCVAYAIEHGDRTFVGEGAPR